MSEEQQSAHAAKKQLSFVLAFALLSVVLLSQIGSEAKFSSKGQLVAQPAFWPGLSLAFMLVFALAGAPGLVRRAKAAIDTPQNGVRNVDRTQARGIESVFSALRVVEFYGWFMLYVWLVPLVGYLPVSVFFAVALALRLGYRSFSSLLYAGLMGCAIVVVFKALLGVKIPGAVLYERLPDALRNIMITYF